MTTIDRADWHYGGDFPPDLPPEAGATHIGMFLAWAASRGLLSDEHLDELKEDLTDLQLRVVSPGGYVMRSMDEKFGSQDLSPEGQAFAATYYTHSATGPTYFNDIGSYADKLDVPSCYHIPDTWEQFEQLTPVIDRRFADWKRLTAPAQPGLLAKVGRWIKRVAAAE